MITIASLTTPLTIDESRASIYSVLAVLGVPTTSWKPAGVTRAVVELVAIIVTGVSYLVSQIARVGFREHATGEWETIRARGFYGLTRIPATFASGQVTLINSGGGIYPLDPGDLIVQNVVTLKTYTNTATVTLNAMATLPVDVIAVEAGSASTAAIGDITGFVTPLNGVTCSNAAALVGTDEETDDAIKLREDASIDAISPNGAPGAYYAVAVNANVGVNRVRVNANSTTSAVTVTVAKPGGALTGGELTTVTNAIMTGNDSPVPLGIASVTVQNVTPVAVPVTMTVRIYTTAGLASATVETMVEDALLAWIDSRPIAGDVIPPATTGYVYVSNLLAAAAGVSPYVFGVSCSLPAADVALAETEVAVLGATTITVVQVAP